MKRWTSKVRLSAMLAVMLGVGALGCELALDFDRTKIDGGAGIDASFADVTGQQDQVSPPVDAADSAPPADAPLDSPADASTTDASDSGADANDGASPADAADASDAADAASE